MFLVTLFTCKSLDFITDALKLKSQCGMWYSIDNRCRELRPYHEEPLFSFSFSCFLLLTLLRLLFLVIVYIADIFQSYSASDYVESKGCQQVNKSSSISVNGPVDCSI